MCSSAHIRGCRLFRRNASAVFVVLAVLAWPTLVDAQVSSRATRFVFDNTLCAMKSGSGSPEGAVVGKVCDIYVQTNGTTWSKTSGTGNTGWIALDASGVVNVRTYGAKGDGVTDDTAAIQAAITAAEASGGAVIVPAGSYLLSGTGAQLLLIQHAITIRGANQATTAFVVKADVGATTDVIRYWRAAATQEFHYFSLSDLRIAPVSGTPARHAIVVDTTDAQIANAQFARLTISQLGGRAFASVNPTLSDGFFLSSIQDSVLMGGVLLQRAGDSISLVRNQIAGTGVGIEADFVAGANNFVVASNSITSAGPAIKIGLGGLVIIRDNNLETVSGGNYPAQPVLDLVGAASGTFTPYVTGNTINALITGTDAIHLDYAVAPYIGPNTVFVNGTGKGIVTTAHTSALRLDKGAISWLGTSTTHVLDTSGTARGLPWLPSVGTAGVLDYVTGIGAAVNWRYSPTYGNSGIDLSFDPGTDAGNIFSFKVNTAAGVATTRVTLLGNGSVGVGTTTPDYKFQVDGTVAPETGYASDLGAYTKKWLTLHAAELRVETLVAQNTIATIGGRILVGPTTMLVADLTDSATTIHVKYNNLANGDRVYLEANGGVEFMSVNSVAGGGAGDYTYTVTRNLDGSGANAWSAGDAVFNTGTTGDGYIDLYSDRSLRSATQYGPTIAGTVRTGTTYSNLEERWAIGNLNGLYGYSADTYGAAFGAPSATNITIDETNGIRIRYGTTNKLIADTSGNLSIVGSMRVGTAGSLYSGASATYGTAGYQLQYNAGTPRAYFGDGSTAYMEWTGSLLKTNNLYAGLLYAGTFSDPYYASYTSADVVRLFPDTFVSAYCAICGGGVAQLLGLNSTTGDVEVHTYNNVTALKVYGYINSTLGTTGNAVYSATPVTGASGTDEKDLQTVSLPASYLKTNGESIRIQAKGTFAANGNTKRCALYFGTTKVAEIGDQAYNDVAWSFDVTVMRIDSTHQKAWGMWAIVGSGATTFLAVAAPGETLSGAVTIKTTGTGATTGADITSDTILVNIIR